MIVEVDFLDHWKTRLLVRLLGTELAPLYVLRLWAHCQTRKTDRFAGWKPTVLASVCRWESDPQILWDGMTETFIECKDGVVIAHGWGEVNASLVSAWNNGKLGGRPKKQAENPPEKPKENRTVNPPKTDRLTDRVDRVDRVEKKGIAAGASDGSFALHGESVKPSWIVEFDLELPENLRTQNCLDAVREWLKYKAERREGYKPTGLKASLNKWGNEFTPANFPQAIQNSMASGWTGIFPPKPQVGPSAGNSRPAWAIKKEIGQRIDRLEEQIGSHKANISSRNCIPDRITHEQETELKALRAQKADLLKQLDALPIE